MNTYDKRIAERLAVYLLHRYALDENAATVDRVVADIRRGEWAEDVELYEGGIQKQPEVGADLASDILAVVRGRTTTPDAALKILVLTAYGMVRGLGVSEERTAELLQQHIDKTKRASAKLTETGKNPLDEPL